MRPAKSPPTLTKETGILTILKKFKDSGVRNVLFTTFVTGTDIDPNIKFPTSTELRLQNNAPSIVNGIYTLYTLNEDGTLKDHMTKS